MLETTPFSRISHPLVPGVKYDLWDRGKGNKDRIGGWLVWGREGELGAVRKGRKAGPAYCPSLPLLLLASLLSFPPPLTETHLVEGVEIPLTHMLLEDPRLRQEG